MYKAAVMGDYDSIYGFASIGLDIFPESGGAEDEKQFRRLLHGDYAIIYVTEALAARLGDEIEKASESITPAVILIPGISGNTGDGVRGVKGSVEKAIGSDIVFGGEQ